MEEDTSNTWKDLFEVRSTSFSGYVTTLTKLEELLQEYDYATSSRFRCLKSSKLFGKDVDVEKIKKSHIRFLDSQPNAEPHIDYDGIPFIIMGKKVLECHQGCDRDNKNNRKKRQIKAREDCDHTYKLKRRLVQNSKKKACPVRIKIRHIVKFSSYSLTGEENTTCTPHHQKKIVANLKEDLRIRPLKNMEHRFYVQFPEVKDHRNHLKGEASSILQPMDKRLSDYIKKVVTEHGVTSTLKMKLLLEVFLRQYIFHNAPMPPKHNKRFWPSLKDIYNHMAAQFLKLRDSRVDQKSVVDMVEEQKKLHPNERFYIRIKKDQEPDSDIDVPDENVLLDEDFIIRNGRKNTALNKFLYVHQTPWQRQLLKRYGNEICLLDATYRTTKYSLPLYFLCVPSNVNYMTVATFILETEDSFSIQEALSIIKAWNPDWKPAYFMCDYAEEEISAIESVFTEAFVYLCDFHREQAWERWLKATHNEVGKDKAEVLILLRSIARSKTVEEFDIAKTKLQESQFWKANNRFRRWFEIRWLNKHKRWVQAFRHKRFNTSVNTNNGVERQNKSLKYEYLDTKKAKSLCHLLTVLWNDFLPDTYQRYVRQNLAAAEEAKTYSACIPDFLKNRPTNVVKHCFRRWEESINITPDEIDQLDDGHFLVKSQTPGSSQVYSLNFSSTEFPVPSCDCDDWAKHHMVCKHFCAIFRHIDGWHWEQLPEEYRNNPFLTLDNDVLMEFNSFPIQNHEEEINQLDHDQPKMGIATEEISKIQDISIPSKSKISKLRTNISSYCQIIKDYSYNCKDIEILQEVCQNLHVNIDVLKRNLSPNADASELILEDPEKEMTHISTTPLNIKRLSLSKKKKKGVGRHGISAEKMKFHYSSKGVDDLLMESNERSFVEEEVITIEDGDEYMHVPDVKGILRKPSSEPSYKKKKTVHFSGYVQEEVKREKIFTMNTNQALKEVKKVWEIENGTGYIIGKVSSFNVTDNDLRSLSGINWLTDQVMDAYLSLIVQREIEKGNKITMYSSQTMTQIVSGTFSVNNCRRKLKLYGYSAILGAICQNRHWTLVIVNPEEGIINYYNPMVERKKEIEEIQRNWCLYTNERMLVYNDVEIKKWTVHTMAHSKQEDSYNCGVYCLMFAERYFSNEPIINIPKSELYSAREKIASALIMFNGYQTDFCPSCGFTANQDNLIACEKCTKTFHRTEACIGLEHMSRGYFICKMCLAKDIHVKPETSFESWFANNSLEDGEFRSKQNSKSKNKVQSLWTEKPVGHLCSKIGHYKLSDKSFHCLKTMLPDEVLDAYMYLVSASHESKKIYHVNCTIMTAIFQGNAELHNYLSEVPKLDEFDVICGALNEGSCHWTLIYVEPKNKLLFYINPLGESYQRLRRVDEKWKEFLFGRENLGMEESTTEWFVHPKKHPRQRDSTSCGVIVLKFLERLLQDEDLDIDIQKGEMMRARENIGQVLLKNSDDFDCNCSHCFTKETTTKESLTSANYDLRKDPKKKRKRSSFLYSDIRGRYLPYSKLRRLRESSTAFTEGSEDFPKQEQMNECMEKKTSAKQIAECNAWLHKSVNAETEQSKKVVSILCEWPRKDLPISKGTGIILGHNIATLFSTHIKAKLKEIMELEAGDKRCYEPHWRHLRWIDRNDLTDHNIMNNSFKGMEERIKLFSKESFTEISALVLEEFALFKPKSIIGLLSPPGYYLSVKNCRNEKLMATLEDGPGQKFNEGVRYFKDVLLVEARIIYASIVKDLHYREAEELLYPMK